MVFLQFTLVHIGTWIVSLSPSNFDLNCGFVIVILMLCSFHLLVLSASSFVSAFPSGGVFVQYYIFLISLPKEELSPRCMYIWHKN